MKYFVTIAGKTVEVEVDGDRVRIDGRTRTAVMAMVGRGPLRQLLVDGRPVGLAVSSDGPGRWALSLAGERWECEVIDERARYIRSLTGAAEQARGPGSLRAPMPGLVVRVQAQSGQQVAAGAGLVVLEAMKMENELRAPGAAVVKVVHARPGDTVEKGQILVEFE